MAIEDLADRLEVVGYGRDGAQRGTDHRLGDERNHGFRADFLQMRLELLCKPLAKSLLGLVVALFAVGVAGGQVVDVDQDGLELTAAPLVAADGEALEAIHTQLGRSGEVTERLAEQFDDAAAKLATAGGDSARLGENLATLSRTIEQISGSVAEQGRNQRNAMAELNKQLRKDVAGLRWLVLAAALLAAVAVVAPFVAKWF